MLSKEPAMRVALAITISLGLTGAALAQTAVTVPAAPALAPAVQPVQPANPTSAVVAAPKTVSVTPSILSAADVAIYRQAFTAARGGQLAKARTLAAKASDP